MPRGYGHCYTVFLSALQLHEEVGQVPVVRANKIGGLHRLAKRQKVVSASLLRHSFLILLQQHQQLFLILGVVGVDVQQEFVKFFLCKGKLDGWLIL